MDFLSIFPGIEHVCACPSATASDWSPRFVPVQATEEPTQASTDAGAKAGEESAAATLGPEAEEGPASPVEAKTEANEEPDASMAAEAEAATPTAGEVEMVEVQPGEAGAEAKEEESKAEEGELEQQQAEVEGGAAAGKEETTEEAPAVQVMEVGRHFAAVLPVEWDLCARRAVRRGASLGCIFAPRAHLAY